jgi:hypothetical protein
MANTRSVFAYSYSQRKGVVVFAYSASPWETSRIRKHGVAVPTVNSLPNLVIFNNWSTPFPCPKMRGVLRSPPPPSPPHPPPNVWLVFYYCYRSNSFLSSYRAHPCTLLSCTLWNSTRMRDFSLVTTIVSVLHCCLLEYDVRRIDTLKSHFRSILLSNKLQFLTAVM